MNVTKRLKPWYKVVTPRADLREGKPLDAAEFAVHLGKVRDSTAPEDYQDPIRFFEKTFLTTTLLELSAQVVRRLNGVKTETSAVFNLATQFGGGKTHALTLLYHLGEQGPHAQKMMGVQRILTAAGQTDIPKPPAQSSSAPNSTPSPAAAAPTGRQFAKPLGARSLGNSAVRMPLTWLQNMINKVFHPAATCWTG